MSRLRYRFSVSRPDRWGSREVSIVRGNPYNKLVVGRVWWSPRRGWQACLNISYAKPKTRTPRLSSFGEAFFWVTVESVRSLTQALEDITASPHGAKENQ